MTQPNNPGVSRLTIWSLAVAFFACPAGVLADKPGQTIPEPGFRPSSKYAVDFLEATGDMQVSVLPTMIRRNERTAHSFASQQQIVDYLNESGLAAAISAPRRIDLGPLRRTSQWEIFQYGEISISEDLGQDHTDIDYTLAMELLVPGNQAVFGIEVYIFDRQGRSAFSFLLNSHHDMFARANLVAKNTSEDARGKMIEAATRVALEALSAQIAQARLIQSVGTRRSSSLKKPSTRTIRKSSLFSTIRNRPSGATS